MTYETLYHRLMAIYDTGEAKAIARWVFDVRFGLSLADILCGKDTQLSANDQAEQEKIAQRLENGEPVQYVLGVGDFYGRQFHVEPGVLIPRPETAELCQWIISQKNRPSVCSVLDVGTGSGCIAITLALEIPEAKVTAWDISEEALCIAQKNAKDLGADIAFERRDALNPSQPAISAQLSAPQWDIIVSNPPYIAPKERDEMEKNVLDYEPDLALFAPEDNPIIFYQRIGDYAFQNLTSNGLLFFELNPITSDDVFNYLQELGFTDIEIKRDQFGKQRFLKATKI